MAGIGKRFVKGDPRAGRPKGVPNKTTLDARRMAQALVSDPEYLAKLRERLIEGKAGPMESLLWAYSFGQPPDRPLYPRAPFFDDLDGFGASMDAR